ncbi:VanZ family protein [Cohnella sp. REN36]|uniref:VanZ family protein n=1 Tax=Cohnella sp. REN36 TaxID=2887347 RepID=UPI001D13BA90|nr:VanZ family protein [Cohnella sp. REN36]MCC3376335.1 VanZ family protein [Cohnella sp. REN36]
MKQKLTQIVFWVYILFIIDIVAIKFTGSIALIKSRMDTMQWNREKYGIWNYNIVPFKTIRAAIESYITLGFDRSVVNSIANVVLFVPMGLLLPLIMRRPSFVKVMFLSLSIIFTIELFQLITCLGIADIDDVILNFLGCIIGYGMQSTYNKVRETRRGEKKEFLESN